MSSVGVRTAAKWAMFGRAGQQMAQIIVTVVLVRLLEPEQFGVMSMAAVVLGYASLFRDAGTTAGVVTDRECDDRLLSTLFVSNLGVVGVLSGAMLLLAPVVASFFKTPEVAWVLRWLALTLFISGLSVVPLALLQRRMDFRSIALIDVLSVVIGGVVAVVMAANHKGLEALVAQGLSAAFVTTLLSLVLARWIPRRMPSKDAWMRSRGFSASVTSYAVANHLSQNWDYLAIGRVLGSAALGSYNLAYRFTLYPLRNIGAVAGSVLLPTLSKTEGPSDLLDKYGRAITIISILSFPISLGLGVMAEEFTLTFFGAGWTGVVLPLRLLAPAGMAQSVMQTGRQVLEARRRGRLLSRLGWMFSISMLLAVLVGMQWGVVGVAAGTSFVSVVMGWSVLAIAVGAVGGSGSMLLGWLMPAGVSSVVMACALALVRLVAPGFEPWEILIVAVVIGVAVYAFSLGILFPNTWRRVKADVFKRGTTQRRSEGAVIS